MATKCVPHLANTCQAQYQGYNYEVHDRFQNYFTGLGEHHQSFSNHIEIEETTTIRCNAPTVGS